ncbi:50S ribosomal protein L24 [Desulfurispirillum indicum]|nr:50S ribosomal protein L24 [Desulfurispirillum indicum]
MKIKRDDQVIVIAGKDKGKTGRVTKVYPQKSRVIVEGINVVKRHRKPTQMSEGGIVEKEMPLHVSNVMYYDADAGKGCRIGFKIEDGKKVRYCKQTGKVID